MASRLAHLFGARVLGMDRSTEPAPSVERKGLRFYGPDDELPPGAAEALKRRTPEELQAAADQATRHS